MYKTYRRQWENWDEGQFDNAEYSAHFQKVEEQQYSPYHTAQSIKYMIPESDYYHSSSQPKQEQKQKPKTGFTTPHTCATVDSLA